MDTEREAPGGAAGGPRGKLTTGPALAGLAIRHAGAPSVLLQAGASRRDFAALIEVVRDDALRLAGGKAKGLRRDGLIAKISSALGVLPLSTRAYLQDHAEALAGSLALVAKARAYFRAENWSALATSLSALCQIYPVRLSAVGVPDVAFAARAYQRSCAMCHRYPETAGEFSAPDLFRMARSESPREFLARMIDGVHGTAFTSFENPLSDGQIMDFYAYFRRGRPPGRP